MESMPVQLELNAVDDACQAASKAEVLRQVARLAAENYGLEADGIFSRLQEREVLGSTGFGGAIAIPHCKTDALESCAGVFLKLRKPVEFAAHDGKPVDMVFALFSPEKGGVDHLKALAFISRFLRDENMVAKLRGAGGRDAVYALLSGQREQQAA